MTSLRADASRPDRRPRPLASSPTLQAIDSDTQTWHDELLTELTRGVIEAALEAELAEHLRLDADDPTSHRSGANCRNGTRAKTVRTVVGTITIDAPRDRWGTFQPVTVRKWQRRVGVLDQLVLPLAAAGTTLDDTIQLMSYAYGRAVSPRLLLMMAASVRARMQRWHERCLPRSYAVVLLDRAVLRSRSVGVVARPVHTAVGVTAEGRRALLGLWMGPTRDPSHGWTEYVAGLRERGLRTVDAVVTDESAAVEDALAALWPQAAVHLRATRTG